MLVHSWHVTLKLSMS